MNLLRRVLIRLREKAANNLNFHLKLPSGLTAVVNSPEEWVIYDEIFQGGEYDFAIARCFTQANPAAPVILDLGANVGYFGLRLIDRWRTEHGDVPFPFEVIGVEGVPVIHQALIRQMRVNQLEPRFHYHLGLAGRRGGTAVISTGRHHARNRIGRPSLLTRLEPKAAQPFLDLEALVGSQRGIALLKCDIEGAEELLLESYPELLARTQTAVLEFHHQFCQVDHCHQLLAAAGLQLVRELKPRDPGGSISVGHFERRPA